MNFLKLGNISNLPDYVSDISLIKFGEVVDGSFYGIEYHRAHINVTEELLQIVPQWALSSLVPTVMKVNRDVPPHIDNGISFVINIYLQTGNCITQFYDVEGEEKSFKIKNQTNGRILNKQCLTPADSFIAEKGDIYLLNVAVPHSVQALDGDTVERVALCYQGRGLSFDSLLSYITGEQEPPALPLGNG